MFKQDFMMRQVEALTRAVAQLVFRRQETDYLPGQEAAAAADGLYFELHNLVADGQLNAAENLLYARRQTDDMHYLEVAVDFYARLNHLSDRDLAAGGFSREEVAEGLQELLDACGISMP